MKRIRNNLVVLSCAIIMIVVGCVLRNSNDQGNQQLPDIFSQSQAFIDTLTRIGGKVAFIVSGDVHIVTSTGRNVIVDTDSAYEMAWAPQGDSLLVKVKQPGSNPFFDLLLVKGETWLEEEYVQMGIFAGSGIDWSPDGNQIVWAGGLSNSFSQTAVGDAGGIGIYISHLDGMGLQLLANCDLYACCSPVWSPDGTSIAFINLQDVEVINFNDPSNRRSVYKLSRSKQEKCSSVKLSWFSDSRRLLVSDGLQIQILDLADHSVDMLFELPPETAEGAVLAVVLPDDKYIAYRANYKEADCDDGLLCFHREIMITNLEDILWKDITPSFDNRFDLSDFDWQ